MTTPRLRAKSKSQISKITRVFRRGQVRRGQIVLYRAGDCAFRRCGDGRCLHPGDRSAIAAWCTRDPDKHVPFNCPWLKQRASLTLIAKAWRDG